MPMGGASSLRALDWGIRTEFETYMDANAGDFTGSCREVWERQNTLIRSTTGCKNA